MLILLLIDCLHSYNSEYVNCRSIKKDLSSGYFHHHRTKLETRNLGLIVTDSLNTYPQICK